MENKKLINVGEKTLELNHGPFHYELAPGEVTMPLGNEMVNNFTSRNPDLRIYDEEEGMLTMPENIETFPTFQDAVDDPDRDVAPQEPQGEDLDEDSTDEPDEPVKSSGEALNVAKGGKKKKR